MQRLKDLKSSFYILPAAILIAGLGVTLLIFTYLEHSRRQMDIQHFQTLVREAQNKIDEKTKRYDVALSGGLGLFAASNSVNGIEWREYVRSIKIAQNIPGLSSLGVAFKVDDSDLNSFLSSKNSELESPLEIKYLNGTRPKEHFIITYLEPNTINQKARGLDLASERSRRLAAEESRDTGESRITDIVRFMVRSENNLGFIYYLPIYKNHMPLMGVEDRRKAHLGFVFGAFFITDFFEDFFSAITPEVDLDVYDGDIIKREKWLYSKDKVYGNDVEAITPFSIGNKKFTLTWQRTPQFHSESQKNVIGLTLFSLIMTFSSAYILYSHKKNHLRAIIMAKKIKEELLQTQSALIQSQKMEAVGQLVSGITHDFNNILGGIIGYASIIQSSASHDSKLTQQIDHIITSASLGSSMLKDLLCFTRKGKFHDEKRIVSANHIVHNTEKLIFASIQRNIELVLKLSPDLWEIVADSGQLTQVLLNLCINARDAMPEGGMLTVGTENCDYKEKPNIYNLPKDEYVHIWVQDTGCGIPMEIREKIFEPFFTTKGEGKGTGLGLSMVSDIIENHGGKILLDKEIIHGTIFHIFIPRNHRTKPSAGTGEGPSEKLLTNDAPMAAR